MASRFNFWLNKGNAPASGQGDEVVISDFAWQKEKIEWLGEYVKVFTNLSNYPIAGQNLLSLSSRGYKIFVLSQKIGYTSAHLAFSAVKERTNGTNKGIHF